ncbi:MAG: SMC-Scp complex subunit ScpB [Candidatus Helarchaeota archaeon]|nr:SMC-Scp complex subunit ScpB [Candidatus Helarchaeota archaeon]
MNHLELLQALLFLRGVEGVSISDIYQIVGKNDMRYAFFLLSSLEDSFQNTPLQLKFIPTAKRYQIVVPHDLVIDLEDRNLVTPIISKAARATLACILMNTVKDEPVTLTLLKQLRGINVIKHLKELEDNGYITQEENHVLITNKLISEIDLPSLIGELKKIDF